MAVTRTVVNVTTGEQTEVELTSEEIAAMEAVTTEWENHQAELAAAAEAKAAAAASAADKLAKLGLTAEEIAALRG